ncbi:hypothetical protein PULV_a3484 [Pseudoalteromonas ulvae UL12]|uniref:CLCA_X family protein n=1 Tax=Pseudoalteromonas ulvae TaxID=107327 RepID=UPI00186B7BCA|nr:CLCA_X family protein [Pseudoalteromonas ulvae]MBE0363301.1 hypothetical protein [Pseudoalteromonas ulvae UL12]
MTTKLNRLKQGLYRRGPDHRTGQDVDFLHIKHHFGFKNLTVGKWVDKQEKQLAANLIYDALADLAWLLNVPSKVIGLRQQLSLSFGTGGQLGVQAHYNSLERCLYLAKNAGAGALAHEWWHAFDHYICPFLLSPDTPLQFASSTWLKQAANISHPLNALLDDVYQTLLLSEDLCQPSDYVHHAISLDKQLQMNYFSLPEELTARAFEAWIQSRTQIKNAYLVSGTKQSKLAELNAFPSPALQRKFGDTLAQYFNLLADLLETKG